MVAGISLGPGQFVRALIEQHEKLNAEPMPALTKIDTLCDYPP